MSAARRIVEAPATKNSGMPAPGKLDAGKAGAASGFLASGLGVALFSSAVFGLSGSFAKALLETGWTPGAAVTDRKSTRQNSSH